MLGLPAPKNWPKSNELSLHKTQGASALLRDLERAKSHVFEQPSIQTSVYRPFTKQTVYFNRDMNDMIYQLPLLFPTPNHPNLGITINGDRRKTGLPLVCASLPDLHLNGDAQVFSLYTWSPLPEETDGSLSLFDVEVSNHETNTNETTINFTRPISTQVPTSIGSYERQDNITDGTLTAYREHYNDTRSPKGEQIEKEDIFFYVYALLHHPGYRERYEADLKKMLPRIPMVPGFWEYSNIGRELAELHVNYELVEPYPIAETWAVDAPEDEWQKYRVEKLAWGKKGRDKDTTRLVYNDHLTFSGIPAEINDYQIGGRSPLEWMIDRYKITVDKKSGIVNDPNDYFREVDNPHYLADLIRSLVTVTMRTLELTKALPELIIDEDTN